MRHIILELLAAAFVAFCLVFPIWAHVNNII